MVNTFPCSACPHNGSGECWSQRSKTKHVCESIALGETKYLGLIDGSGIVKVDPSLIQKAVNFASAVVEHVADGMPIASPEVQTERMAICKACDLFDGVNTCRDCGCNLKLKTSWLGMSCPIGKW